MCWKHHHTRLQKIIDGTLHLNPRPTSRHAWASSVLGGCVGPPFNRGQGGPGGWWIIDEPELHFGEDILVPDLAGWRRQKMPEYPDCAFFTLAPDWVCEVLSPSTRAIDQGVKRTIYAREGVGHHLWFGDPDANTLEAFELKDSHWILPDTIVGSAQVSLPPFKAISFNLGDLWPDAGIEAGGGQEGTG